MTYAFGRLDTMTGTQNTFTAADLDTIRSMTEFKADFTRFVLDRFATYTQRNTPTLDIRGRIGSPVENPHARTGGGYGHWRLKPGWDNPTNATQPHVTIEHWLSDDRGPGSVTSTIHVPWDYIFGTQERNERYETYLALRAEFEDRNTTNSAQNTTAAAPWPTNDHERERFLDWQHEVANGDTNTSFRDWLTNNTD